MAAPMVKKSWMRNSFNIAAVVLMLLFLSTDCEAHLSPKFYDNTCPNALSTIRTAIRTAVSRERQMAASLVRLHFHDCFVQGCDASILLKDSPSITSERNALQNKDSVRGYEVIDSAKAEVEKTCPGVVSCADILALAARDASVAVSIYIYIYIYISFAKSKITFWWSSFSLKKQVGGPSWTVKLGRRDSTTASLTLAERELPTAADNLDKLISNFAGKGLSARDMVALSG